MPKPKQELIEIPLDLIKRDPRQPRRRFDPEEIQKLAKSIEAEECLQPPVVKPHPNEPSCYLIVAGERRIRAHQLLKRETVLCILRRGESDTFIASVVENLHKLDFTPIEEALVVKRLRDEYGMRWAEIEQLTGKSISTLSDRLKLLELPQEIQEMVDGGTLPQSGALNLAQYRGSKGDLMRLARRLVDGEKPLELEGHKPSRVKKIRSSMPSSPEGLFRRVVKLAQQSPSIVPTVEAFLEFRPEDHSRVLGLVHPEVRRKTLRQLIDLVRVLGGLVEALGKLSGDDEEISSLLSQLPQALQPTGAQPAELGELGEEDVEVFEETLRVESTLDKRTIHETLTVLEFFQESYIGGIDGNRERKILSKRRLKEILKVKRSSESVEEKVLGVLKTVRDNWYRPPNSKSPLEDGLIILISNVRSLFEVETFGEFIANLKRFDRSDDPVNIDSLLA